MTRHPSRRASRSLTFLALPAAAAIALAGCAPIETDRPYSPSDGLRVNLTDEVRGLNLMLVTSEEGAPGALVGALSNASDQDLDITIAPETGSSLVIPVVAGETVYLNADGGLPVELPVVAAAPGGMLPVVISSSAGDSEQLSLPVFDGTLPEYAHLVP